LYYISTGDCIVNVVDQNAKVRENIRLLVEGDHFGEIALLYPGCTRTCTVISRNYNTMASLEFRSLRSLNSEYPEYKKLLIKNIFKYNDPKLKFLKKMINKLTYV
jgi:CRP-like cAMP-binding protein